MSELQVRWQHHPFLPEAGQRADKASPPQIGPNEQATHLGILTDEHHDVVDGRPVLVENNTGRVYQAADLPPNTRIVVGELKTAPGSIVQQAPRAGFELVSD